MQKNVTAIAIATGLVGSVLALAPPVQAQELSDEAMKSQITQLEARVAQLKHLKALRDEQKALEAELAASSPGATTTAAVGAALVTGAKDEAPSSGNTKVAETPKPASQGATPEPDPGRQKFGGIEFGIGTAFTSDLGRNDRIKEAEVVNNIVRVKDEENVRARIVLESHYFFTPKNWNLFGVKNGSTSKDANLGIGPFIAFQPGTDNVIEGIGAGIMIGLRRPKEGSSESFNIGIGVMYDLNTRLLGEGLTRNQPLPAGDTLRYRETSQSGLLIMSSYSF